MRLTSLQLPDVITLRERVWLLPVLVAVTGALITPAAIFLLALSVFVGLYLSAAQLEFAHTVLLRRLIIISGALLLALAGFNYIINPFGLYATHFFEPISLSSRTEKMRLYSARPEAPLALVLGSSRSFTVDPQQVEDLWGYPAFNASVGAGMMNDHLAFVNFASQTRAVPRLLILNVEFDGFIPYDNSQAEPSATLWRYLENDNALSSVTAGWDRFSRLFTLEQVKASMQLLEAEQKGRTQGFYNFLPDGRIHFDEPLTLEEAVSRSLANNIAAGWGKVYTPSNIAPAKLDLLRRLLAFAREHGISVLGYIPPLHPQFTQYLDAESDFRSFQASLTQTFQQLEQDYPFRFMDFTDSPLFKGEHLDELFSDGVHLKEQGSRLIMQALHDAFPQGF